MIRLNINRNKIQDMEITEDTFSMESRVRARVLLPVFISLLLLIMGVIISMYVYSRSRIIDESRRISESAFNNFEFQVFQLAYSMEKNLQIISMNSAIKSAFLSKDRQLLKELSKPILNNFKEKSSTTHLYFINKDRKCFLRVHHPERQGDIIDRYTAIQAEETGKTASGIELGLLGTLTLRVVLPWKDNGELAGYIELGDEIGNIVEDLKKNTGIDFVIGIYKKYLDRGLWEEGMEMLGRKSDWDKFNSMIPVFRTMQNLPDTVLQRPLDIEPNAEYQEKGEVDKFGHLQLEQYNLIDAGNRKVGVMLAVMDTGIEKESLKKQIASAVILCTGIGGLLMIFFYFYLGRLEKSIEKNNSLLNDTYIELRNSETKYRSMMENMKDAAYICSPDYRIEYMNPTMAEMIGADMLGKPCHEAIYKSDEKCARCSLDETGNQDYLEYEMIHPVSGEYYSVAGTPIVNQDGSFSRLTVFRNISHIKDMEQKLHRAEKMELIGSLAGGVAHDLNNVLSGLVSYPELMLMDLPEDSNLRRHVEMIRRSGEKAAAIVQDLLTLARRGVSVTDVVNLKAVVQEYLESADFEKVKKYHNGLKVETHIEEDLLNIIGSPVHLYKSLMNLVANGAEAMQGGGTIKISLENIYVDEPIKGYDTVAEGDYVLLKVEDRGTGIPHEDIEQIFEPFFTKKKMGRSGTGLGMTVVWGTVKDHKGYIDVRSSREKGTAFHLYFPATRKETEKKESKIEYDDYMGKGETILVVDDIEEQRNIAEDILNRLKYNVRTVESGEKAVEYLSNNSADLVILDMIMAPGMDGYDTYRKIIKIHPGQKAIIVSGFSETGRIKKVQDMGAGVHIKKPYTIETIGLAIKKILSEVQT